MAVVAQQMRYFFNLRSKRFHSTCGGLLPGMNNAHPIPWVIIYSNAYELRPAKLRLHATPEKGNDHKDGDDNHCATKTELEMRRVLNCGIQT